MSNPVQNKELTFSPLKVNVVTLILSILFVALVILIYLLTFGPFKIVVKLPDFLLFFLCSAISIFLHEGIHGIGYRYFGPCSWKDIKFGFLWKAMAPYAHCKVPLKTSSYKIAGALPTLLLGLIPLVIGFILNNGFTILFSTFMVIGGMGDLLLLWSIRKLPKGTLLKDHPEKLGCEIYKSPTP